MKTAISVDAELLIEADRTAHQLGLSRSRLLSIALEAYLRDRRQQETLERLNRAYAGKPDRASSATLKRVAVGTLVAQSPPHGSVRADFPHTALILDVWRQSEHSDTGAEFVAMEATG